MFPKAKRFHETGSCAPPVGKYNLGGEADKKRGAVMFSKSKRFIDGKEAGPGPADTSCSSVLDASNCSVISLRSDAHSSRDFMSPLPLKKARRVGLCSSTPDMSKAEDLKEIRRLIQERIEMDNRLVAVQEDVKRLEGKLQGLLKEKSTLESAVASLEKDNQDLRRGNDILQSKISSSCTTTKTAENLKCQLAAVMTKLHEKEQELSGLRVDLRCKVEGLDADIKVQRSRNLSLSERIISLENQNQEVVCDRDQAEEEIRKLHGIIDQLRSENNIMKEKLEQKEEQLKLLEERIESCFKEGEHKIKSLHDTVLQEIKKSKTLEQKIEDCKQTYETKLSDAQGNSETLKMLQSELEEKVYNLEKKLVEMREREQQAQDRASCLEREKIAAESRLESHASQYEQKLASAIAQVEALQNELTCSEEMMTDNLRSLTAKYEDLEQLHANFKCKRDSEFKRLSAELEATKTSLNNSKEERNQFQSVVEDLREEMTTMEEKKQELATSNESLLGKLQNKQSAKDLLEERLAQILQERESEKVDMATRVRQDQDSISCLQEREKLLSKELERALSTQLRQDEELIVAREELERVKSESKEYKEEFCLQVERYKTENERISLQLKDMKERQSRETTCAEERTIKIKEEFGRRLVETQKKLSQTEINFSRFKEEQELKMNKVIEEGERRREECAEQIRSEVKELYERKLKYAEEEIETLEEKLNRKTLGDDSNLANLKAEIERWRSKCEEQQEKMRPFKEQLDRFEAEKKALLSQNSQAQDEVTKLGLQYAKLLGHQNHKQKIHHVQRLKEENIGLKSEVHRLTELCEKLKKNTKKIEEKYEVTGKKRFDTGKAFSHSSRKENTPLSEINNGNTGVKRS